MIPRVSFNRNIQTADRFREVVRDNQTILEFRRSHSMLAALDLRTRIIDGLADETTFEDLLDVYIKGFEPGYSMVGNYVITKINGVNRAFVIEGFENRHMQNRLYKLTTREKTSLHDFVSILSPTEYDMGG